ncbi:MAG: stage II sporulation protein P [Firmicutes bacterium]|nr:stage II sporulation protein P [Bacillota bacterium]
MPRTLAALLSLGLVWLAGLGLVRGIGLPGPDPVGLVAAALPAVAREHLEPPWPLPNGPEGWLALQLPFLNPRVAVRPPAEVAVASEAEVPESDPEIRVGVYHTHTGETYRDDGRARVEGGRGGVVDVGAVLAKTLREVYGIGAVHSDRIHDETYDRAYLESEQTARQMLAEHPEIEALLDVHRDSGRARRDAVAVIGGQEVARILLVVGSDARQPFPKWRENYEFARRLSARMDRLYPGLSLGVRVKEGRYNQYLHPHALIVEVGSTANTRAEAERAARLLAEVLARELGAQ